MVDKNEFSHLVKEALANLYDPVHLRMHPLISLLGLAENPGESPGEALRSLLWDAVESLKPSASVPVTRPEWLGYRVLQLHYVRLLSPSEACSELGLSESTFYRWQRNALAAITTSLWNAYTTTRSAAMEDQVGEPPEPHDGQAGSQIVELASTWPREPVDLVEVLEGVNATLVPLAEQHSVALRMCLLPDLPAVCANLAILRQLLIFLLAAAIEFAHEDSIEVSVTPASGEARCYVKRLGRLTTQDIQRESGFLISEELLRIYGGRLTIGRDEHGDPLLMFALPLVRQELILIVDDNPDTVNLYRRYLQDQGYLVRGAHTPEQVEEAFSRETPGLILLDVMMPHEDGWSLLQHLKACPERARIPVVVCSVIDQPRLALALGAAEVLKKPIAPAVLARAVRAHLDREGS